VRGDPGATADGDYTDWFNGRGVVVALQRPDFVLFGTATEPTAIPPLLLTRRDALQPT